MDRLHQGTQNHRLAATAMLAVARGVLVSRIGGWQHRGMVAVGTAAIRTRPRPFSSPPSSKKNSATASHETPLSPPPQDTNAGYKQGMEQLKQTNPTLHRMAPTRGGTDLPDAKFMAIFAVVAVAGFCSWFIHDPQECNGAK